MYLTLLFFVQAMDVEANFSPERKINRDSKDYPVGDFSSVFLKGAFKVYLIQGKENSLEVKASDSKAFDYLNVQNRNGVLKLHVDREPFDFSKVTLLITFSHLERLEIEGGVTLDTKGYLDLNDIFVRVEGGAKIHFKAKAHHIGIKSEGGVLFELDGVTEVLEAKVYGAGHIDAGKLQCRDVSFRIDGVGTGRVYATRTLTAEINGMGKIRYKGNPRVTENIEGLGSVKRE